MKLHSHIDRIPDHARVFLRADANLQLIDGEIQNDFRLQALKPTLDALTNKYCTIIFATHIGRPASHDRNLSTQHLLPWFSQHGYRAQYAATMHEAHAMSEHNKPLIIVLENLRFFEKEKEQSNSFAKELASLAEFYVDDAFATLHRKDTSIFVLPQLFPPKKRMIGLLVESELCHLTKLLEQPRDGYTLILGGGKVATKIPLMQAMLERVDTILLCPAIVFTFLHALGKPTGNSLVDENSIALCKTIIETAQKTGTQLIYPIDYQVACDDFDGPLEYTADSTIPSNCIGMSIGPLTIATFSDIISNSKTIFYNGLMGSYERKETLIGTKALFAAIEQSDSYSVIAGGDSVAILEQFDPDYSENISYVSTGGGATLAFLSGQPLPGLIALNK